MNTKVSSMPDAIAIADTSAMSAGTTAPKYIDTTANNANGNEKLTPENQFLVLHSHISPNVRYMRVLINAGARSIKNRAFDRLILSANRASSITSSFKPS